MSPNLIFSFHPFTGSSEKCEMVKGGFDSSPHIRMLKMRKLKIGDVSECG